MKGQKLPELTTDAERGPADGLGAVVPSRECDHAECSAAPRADLGNVVAFASRSRKAAAKAPAIEVPVDDRPAPRVYSPDRRRHIAFLVGGSLLVHGAILAAFNRDPEPLASIGMISVSAEIVLGAHTNAGRAATQTDSEGIETPFSPENDAPTDSTPESAHKDVAKNPVDEPIEAKREEALAKLQEPLPAEKPPEPSAQAELVIEPKPIEKPMLTPDQKKPEAKDQRKVREAARHAKGDGDSKRERAAPASAPTTGSNSVGRGRSDLDTNYPGRVAAHLARFKQYPADAQSRGKRGDVTVSFDLGGGGNVTSVRLVRGSGVPSIDQEATSMVRRASPFPAPPPAASRSFTITNHFDLR